MSPYRLPQYLEHMQTAAERARSFVSHLNEAAFLADVRTQMAVTMALVMIGDSAGRIIAAAPDFNMEHPEIPWAAIQGWRNLVAYDYFRRELEAIWHSTQTDLPDLIANLDSIRHWRAEGE